MIVPAAMSNLSGLVKENAEPETSKRMAELETLFPQRKCWGENSWGHFRGFNLDLTIENPEPLSICIYELARNTYREDDMRVILIPGRLSLEKIRLILKKANITLPIIIEPQIEAQIKETEKAAIYVVQTNTEDTSIEGENFDLITLVTLVATSHGTVKGQTVLFEGKTILCNDQDGRNLAVMVTKDEIRIAQCDPSDPNVVSGTMVKAT